MVIKLYFCSLIVNNCGCVFSFGHVFLVDTGTSNGTIGGPSKPINSCDFRPARPFKIIAGSEDNSVTIFEGTESYHTKAIRLLLAWLQK